MTRYLASTLVAAIRGVFAVSSIDALGAGGPEKWLGEIEEDVRCVDHGRKCSTRYK